eukprot:6613797-Alexandrium_andersonii.AAC.1
MPAVRPPAPEAASFSRRPSAAPALGTSPAARAEPPPAVLAEGAPRPASRAGRTWPPSTASGPARAGSTA